MGGTQLATVAVVKVALRLNTSRALGTLVHAVYLSPEDDKGGTRSPFLTADESTYRGIDTDEYVGGHGRYAWYVGARVSIVDIVMHKHSK